MDDVWFVVCAANDCEASVWGPCFSEEAAQDESAVRCENAHFITQQLPREAPSIPGGCQQTMDDYPRAWSWVQEHFPRVSA